MNPESRIYLDAHATTPLSEEVFDAMKPYFLEKFGNASSKTHSYGWDADLGVETARKQVAHLLQALNKEIYFTSGATESNNLALRGCLNFGSHEKQHVISTHTEHKSSLETLKYLETQKIEVTRLSPDKYGRVSAKDVEAAIRPHTKLVSIIWANNEIGTLNPILEIGNICEAHNVPFHVDACQGLAYLPLDVQKNKISLLSLSAHKMYGPKGIGALFVRQLPQRVSLSPILFGAGHEKGLRPGTLNVPAIVGLGAAAEIAQKNATQDHHKLAEFRDTMLIELLELPFVKLNGHPTLRLPNNLNLTFEGLSSTDLIRNLKNLALSTGSACSSGEMEPSPILKALGLSEEQIACTLRIGLHKFLTEKDCQIATDLIKKAALHLKERSFGS